MSLNAFEDGVTILNQNNLNALQSSQNKVAIRDGTLIDSKTGSGVVDFEVKDYSFVVRVTATGVTELSRIELEIDKDGDGQDLNVVVLGSDFNPNGSAEGTVLKNIWVPKEFLPSTAAYWSIPLDLTGLTAGQNVWVKIPRSGDSTNHFSLRGESAQDASHPCYYRGGNSGAWTATNAIHFKVFSGEYGRLRHSNYGDNGWKTIERNSQGKISKIFRYLPPVSGPDGGIRNINTLSYSSNRFKRGVIF